MRGKRRMWEKSAIEIDGWWAYGPVGLWATILGPFLYLYPIQAPIGPSPLCPRAAVSRTPATPRPRHHHRSRPTSPRHRVPSFSAPSVHNLERLAFEMASPTLKPGVPITLRELEPSSEMFKQGASLRVTGELHSYNVDSAVAVIQDGSVSLKVDTRHLRDINFRVKSTYQFIGELLIRPDNDAILQARVGRNVDGLDLNLYQQALIIRQKHVAKLLSFRRA